MNVVKKYKILLWYCCYNPYKMRGYLGRIMFGLWYNKMNNILFEDWDIKIYYWDIRGSGRIYSIFGCLCDGNLLGLKSVKNWKRECYYIILERGSKCPFLFYQDQHPNNKQSSETFYHPWNNLLPTASSFEIKYKTHQTVRCNPYLKRYITNSANTVTSLY